MRRFGIGTYFTYYPLYNFIRKVALIYRSFRDVWGSHNLLAALKRGVTKRTMSHLADRVLTTMINEKL